MNKILIVTLCAIALFGCAKKNNASIQNTVSITGKWSVKADTLRIYDNNVLKSTSVLGLATSPYIQFNTDATGTTMMDESGAGTTQRFTYSVTGKTITFNFPAQTISGAQQAAYTQSATIKQQSANSLTILFDDHSTSGGITEEDAEITYLTK